MTMPYPIELRFWENVEKKESGCWEWIGFRDPRGYGKLFVKTIRKNYKWQQISMLAHRFAFEQEYGPFDQKLCVLHRCDNPPCIRPDHLFLGTRTDNFNDMVAKGRAFLKNGAKLTEEQVLEIRKRSAQGEGHVALSKIFGIAPTNIWKLISGRAWREVGFDPNNIPSFRTLNLEKANEIRMKYSIGGVSIRDLAKEYGIVESGVNGILRNENWKIPEKENPIKTKNFRPSGDAHHGSKLSEQQRQDVIAEYQNSMITKDALATKYSVNPCTIRRLLAKAGFGGRRGFIPPPDPITVMP